MVSPDEPVSDAEFEAALEEHGLVPPDTGRPGWTRGRVLAIVAIVVMAGFWMWAFSPLAPRGHPDELDDPAFAALAEERCTRALEDLELIPRALEAESPEERATQLVRSNALFTSMVADLREDAPPAGTRDGALVGQWLADWDVYLDDRDAYRARLELGVDTAFEVSARDRRQITSSIDLFADVNGMPSCMTPGDV